jgi:hypothetical protein
MRIEITLLTLLATVAISACSFRSSNDGVSPVGLTPAAWAALSQPGESHRLLEIFEGEWDATITVRSGPGEISQVSNGHSNIHWILGKRFLQEDFKGETSGEKFDGMGLLGFDNGARAFKMVWVDSLNTALSVSTGTYVPESSIFEMVSAVYDPLLGREKTVRSTLRVMSNDSYRFVMEDTAPSGKKFTSFEILYIRHRSS